jgi:hypothetical protein
MIFEDKNKPIVLGPTGNISEKVALVRNLYDKAYDKINHFDRLRQQLLNYAFLAFSALLAFILKTENAIMQIIACVGIIFLMVMFRFLDQRHHKGTHGFASSMYIFTQVMAYLLENPAEEVTFYQYHEDGEKKTQRWSLQTKIYAFLAASTFALAVIILVRMLTKR